MSNRRLLTGLHLLAEKPIVPCCTFVLSPSLHGPARRHRGIFEIPLEDEACCKKMSERRARNEMPSKVRNFLCGEIVKWFVLAFVEVNTVVVENIGTFFHY